MSREARVAETARQDAEWTAGAHYRYTGPETSLLDHDEVVAAVEWMHGEARVVPLDLYTVALIYGTTVAAQWVPTSELVPADGAR